MDSEIDCEDCRDRRCLNARTAETGNLNARGRAAETEDLNARSAETEST